MIVLGIVLVADDDPAEVVQPRDEAFNLPATLVSPQWTIILGFRLGPIAAVGCDHLNPLVCELLVKRVAIIGFIANQAFRLLIDKTRGESRLNTGDFMWPSRVNVDGGVPFGQRLAPSAIAMIFVPLPRLVAPTLQPLF